MQLTLNSISFSEQKHDKILQSYKGVNFLCKLLPCYHVPAYWEFRNHTKDLTFIMLIYDESSSALFSKRTDSNLYSVAWAMRDNERLFNESYERLLLREIIPGIYFCYKKFGEIIWFQVLYFPLFCFHRYILGHWDVLSR